MPTGLKTKVLKPFRTKTEEAPAPTPQPVRRDTITRTTYNEDGSVTVYQFDPAAPEGERETVQTFTADEAQRQQPHTNPTPAAELAAIEKQLRGLA